MIKFFCDLCGKEATQPNNQPVFQTLIAPKPGPFGCIEKVGIRLIRSVGNVWNGGVLCNPCLAKALRNVVDQLENETTEEAVG